MSVSIWVILVFVFLNYCQGCMPGPQHARYNADVAHHFLRLYLYNCGCIGKKKWRCDYTRAIHSRLEFSFGLKCTTFITLNGSSIWAFENICGVAALELAECSRTQTLHPFLTCFAENVTLGFQTFFRLTDPARWGDRPIAWNLAVYPYT